MCLLPDWAGRRRHWWVEQARKMAHATLGEIAAGVDPVAKKQAERLTGTSLEDAFEDYLATRKDLKAMEETQ